MPGKVRGFVGVWAGVGVGGHGEELVQLGVRMGPFTHIISAL